MVDAILTFFASTPIFYLLPFFICRSYKFSIHTRHTKLTSVEERNAPSDGDIAQLARAMALQAIGRGFESHYLQ